jgi:hypothetical protein
MDWIDRATNFSPAALFPLNHTGAGSSDYKFYRTRLQP